MKYVIYILTAALIIWAVWYLIRAVRRQIKGGCGCACRGTECKNCKR